MKLQTKMEKSGSSGCGSQQRLFKKSTTYLAKIAVVLQDAPGKMLTFPQLMAKLQPIVSGERRIVEGNIRVCLSSNNCFVKIPLIIDFIDSKRNYWKLDVSQVTPKMVRRHFKGLLQLFPELACKVETPEQSSPAPLSPESSSYSTEQIRCEVKFSGPFSIESLLKRDSTPPRAPVPCSVSVRAEQQGVMKKMSLSWDSEQLLQQASDSSYPVVSAEGGTHHGLCKPIRRTHVYSSFPVYSRAHYNIPNSGYITHSLPASTHDALRFC
ncbi:forkhead box protein H1 [Xyrichtys novacula]|nr:forkhead box protein H1 [Xyrichtys novacula]